jgi:acetyl esterase/lipase
MAVRQPAASRVLFLHGGGFIFPAQLSHWRAVDQIVRQTGVQLWFCSYPLLPQGDMRDAFEVVAECYRQMCARPTAPVVLLGDSAGAMMSLGICHWIRESEPVLPLPRQLILLSPGQGLVDDPELLERMRAIEPRDVMLTVTLLESLQTLMSMWGSEDGFLRKPLEDDFSGYPPMTVYIGTSEIFCPLMEGFIARVRAAEVPVRLEAGEGLCHVWPYVPLAPEASRARRQICELIGSSADQ